MSNLVSPALGPALVRALRVVLLFSMGMVALSGTSVASDPVGLQDLPTVCYDKETGYYKISTSCTGGCLTLDCVNTCIGFDGACVGVSSTPADGIVITVCGPSTCTVVPTGIHDPVEFTQRFKDTVVAQAWERLGNPVLP